MGVFAYVLLLKVLLYKVLCFYYTVEAIPSDEVYVFEALWVSGYLN